MSFFTGVVGSAKGVQPSFRQDFTKSEILDPRITFTRNSVATRFNSAGVLETVAANVPRFDYDPLALSPLGILIEESRANLVRNANVTGAFPGVLGAGGGLPTTWSFFSGDNNRVKEVIGSGVENGIPYFDFKISGLSVSGARSYIYVGGNASSVFSTGQTLTRSTYFKLLTPLVGVAVSLHLEGRDNSNTIVETYGSNVTSQLDITWKRVVATNTVTNANTTRGNVMFQFETTANVDVNCTIRIGMPQLEEGTFATSWIPTTTSGPATRQADIAIITGTNFSSIYNNAGSTIVAEYCPAVISASIQRVFSLTPASGSGYIRTRIGNLGSTTFFQNINSTGTIDAAFTTGVIDIVGNIYRMAIAIKTNEIRASKLGLAVQEDNACDPVIFTTLGIGNNGAAEKPNGYIRNLIIFPTMLSNEQLQNLSKVA